VHLTFQLPHIGEAVLRREDDRFLTGTGQYTDDITLGAQTYAVFVRSPHAHARLRSVNTDAARQPQAWSACSPARTAADGINGLPCGWLITSTNGEPMKEPPHPILALDTVRYVGDQVAMVVAETLQQARDAAELVEVDYEVLPAVVNVADAAGGKSPVPWFTTSPRTTTATSGRLATKARWMPCLPAPPM
jgi:carbon-monoxide dehydrogenase large subunit